LSTPAARRGARLGALLDRGLTLLEEIIISVGLAAATLLLFANVVARYVFSSGFSWVLETVQYLFAWVVLIGAAHGVKTGIHLGIDLVVEKLPPRWQRWVVLLAWSLCFGFVVAVLVLSVEYTLKIRAWGDLTLDLQIPQWIPYLAIPIGLTLMAIRFLQVGWLIWQGKVQRVARAEHADVRDPGS
jgi:C4-dicarboxylate transporter DctQ subunit